jgi:hypothetical protein
MHPRLLETLTPSAPRVVEERHKKVPDTVPDAFFFVQHLVFRPRDETAVPRTLRELGHVLPPAR